MKDVTMEISKTKQANIDRAIRQIERGFKILNANKCSTFCTGDQVHIFPAPRLPRDNRGSVDQEFLIDSASIDCDSDCGDW